MRLGRHHVQRGAALLVTTALAWSILTVGAEGSDVDVEVGMPAPREYKAERSDEVENTALTEQRRREAAAAVEPVYTRRADTERGVYDNVNALFAAIGAGVVPEDLPEPPVDEEPVPTTEPATTTTAAETTTTVGEEEASTTSTAVETVSLTGRLVLDGNGDAVFDPAATDVLLPDVGLPNVNIRIGHAGGTSLAVTEQDGTFATVVGEGPVTVTVDTGDPDFPSPAVLTIGEQPLTGECVAQEGCEIDMFGYQPVVTPLDQQVGRLSRDFPDISEAALTTLARIATRDVVREATGQPQRLNDVRSSVIGRLTLIFEGGLRSPDQEQQARQNVRNSPPQILTSEGLPDEEAQSAAAEIIITYVRQNEFVDEDATEARRNEEAASVDPVMVPFTRGATIVREGDPITEFHRDVIGQLTTDPARVAGDLARLALVALTVALLAFYLARFRPQFWNRPRMVWLIAVIIVMGAAAIRGTVAVHEQASWYVLPAVAIGYFAAVLFDARMGTLMAMTMGVLTAIGTLLPGPIVFASLATMAPIGFVSAVSSRRAFRNSVAVSAVAVGVIAGATSWLFTVNLTGDVLPAIALDMAWAFGAALIASLVALAAMPFFESIFDVTTTLRLLELTDRNHEALQLLQEKAFGTFNHSLMVGTLADAATRAIDADNILARAAAYYHDIGKTENPLFFIENQFGIPNPHDHLAPEESAQIVRRHVLDGTRLAKKYKIPTEVAEGIQSHHGDAIMRFFYEKARKQDPDVDPDLFRHAGHKPTSREMAIVMMADSVEGACRAVFGEEEPTPDAITKVVNRVIDEKLADGQLSECDLTLGELTRVRKAFIDALIGHYHQRIPYPNFPGS